MSKAIRNIGDHGMSRNAVGPTPDKKVQNLIEITHRLLRHQGLRTPERQRCYCKVQSFLQASIEQCTNARQHPRSGRFKIGLKQIGDENNCRKSKKGGDAAAREYAIVHLQHIKGPGQH